MDLYIGKMLDNRYELLERIGTGGMANVYKAKCHRLNRLVAVKILKNDFVQNEEFRRRFNAESQAVAQLSHPNIVSVYDVSRGGETEYIVMELIDGITLKQYMEKRGQLNWRESLHFITQIMRGLSHAHSRGIVHRDIKPQNVMVLRDGSVRVTDFGIACLENSTQTLTQEALGSVHYISPEQARGDRTDPRSDVYSSGVVLYEMLTGRLPFEGDSAVSVAIQHLSSIPLAPREINKEIPEQLELICMKAMASDLQKRYPSAEAMITDLEAFRKNPGVSLDFEMADLRGEEVDEPTRPLRVAQSVRPAAEPPAAAPSRSAPSAPPRQRRREADYENTARRSDGIRIALIGVAVVLAAVLAVVLFKNVLGSFEKTQPPTEYIVPSVVGKTLEEANELPSVKGIFTIEEKKSEFSREYEAGEIIRQTPADGEIRKGNSLVIEVVTSLGEKSGQMIEVTNNEVQAAILKLNALSRESELELIVDASVEYQEFSDEITAGYVIRTEPAAGTELKVGDTVKLYVSKGPEKKPVTVPSFLNRNIDDVRKELVSAWKLTCTDADITYAPSTEPVGTVIWQSIPSTTEVMEGDTIRFTVSSGITPSAGNLIEINCILPIDGPEQINLRVTVDGEEQYNAMVDIRNRYVVVPVTGYGLLPIHVYHDGVLAETFDLQF